MHRRLAVLSSFVVVLGSLVGLPLLLTSAAGASTTTYTPDTPVVATITSPPSCTATATATCAPWNTSQGDPDYPSYTSSGTGTVLPTYTPGGATSDVGGITEPNLAVYPSASSGTDGVAPYPSGVVGTPGPLAGYCGTGTQTEASDGTPQRQPADTTLPFSPAYFPHIVRNSDGSLTGYFDERPKDADESIVAATSTDNGEDWTYDSQALDQNPGYCPSSDTNDDGEGHPNVIEVGGVSRLYTLERAAGDNTGVGMLVHTLDATPSNPLNGVPTVEQTGVDPDDFAAAAVSVPTTGGTPATVTFSQPVGSGPEALVAGEFVDLTQTPVPNASDVISCTSVGTQSLGGCTTADPSGIDVAAGDLIEQVLGSVSSNLAHSGPATACSTGSSVPTASGAGALPCQVPPGPNTTNGDGGLEGFGLTVTNPDNTDMAIFNANAPNRAYIDGVPVYCNQANAYPTTRVENCTTGPDGSALTVSAGDPVTSDPIVPATAQQTTGLVAPDGIVGVLPTYPGAPAGSTVVMYTEKILNYFIAGETTASGSTAFSTVGTTGTGTVNFFPGSAFPQDLPTPSASSPVTVEMGDNTLAGDTPAQDVFVPVTCTGLTGGPTVSGLATDTLTGCSVPSSISGTNYSPSDKFKSNSFLAAPGAALVSGTTLAETGEGSATNAQKLFKNNEDLTVLRVAYTTDGVDFSTTGLADGGIISGADDGTTTATGATDCLSSSEGSAGSSYTDINDPCTATSPSNLNAYDTAGTALATEMRWVGSAGSIIVNPDGSYGLFLSGAWAGDGDSDAFNQIFYATSTDGEHWSTPTDVISTDYTFSASRTQDQELAAGQDDPLGVSAYYSGRAYGPSVVQNPDGTLTMVFAGYRLPKPITNAGTALGTNASAQYTVGADDPALYRNIMAVTLTSSTSPTVGTTTTVTSSPASPVVGQPVTYTATVSVDSPGTGTPTGTVTFTGDGGTLCSGPQTLSDTTPDTATCTTTYTSTAGDSVTASYSGDDNYSSSTSQPYAETIGQSPTTTSVTASSDPSPPVVGQSVTYTATVAASGNGAGTPTGSVTFQGNGGTICSDAALIDTGGSDVATCTTSYSTAQTDDVTATYHGDTDFATSTSAPATAETVDPASTTTVVTASSDPSPPVVGQTVTYTATVSVDSPGAGTPTGSVTFQGNAGAICSDVVLSDTGGSDVATCTTSYSTAQTDDVTATYHGDTSFTGSTSAPATAETIGQAATGIGLTASPTSAVTGEPVTFTATVSVASPGSGTPTGSVTFTGAAGTLCSGSQPLVESGGADTATCTVTYSSAQTDAVSATYGGDDDFAGSATASPLSEKVTLAATTTTLTTSADPAVSGESVTWTATVHPVAPSTQTPAGTVTFAFSQVPGKAQPACAGGDVPSLSGGVATCTLTIALGDSPVRVTAAYGGDGADGASSASPVVESVGTASTTTTVTSSGDPSPAGAPVSFTADVAAVSPATGQPTGSVTFAVLAADGSSVRCTGGDVVKVTATGAATCRVGSGLLTLTGAPYTVLATYDGSGAFGASTSQPITQSVEHATATVEVSASTASAKAGRGVTLKVTVAPAVKGSPTPTGTVTFDLTGPDSFPVACSGGDTVTLSGGAATCQVPGTALDGEGASALSAEVAYSGDATYAPADGFFN